MGSRGLSESCVAASAPELGQPTENSYGLSSGAVVAAILLHEKILKRVSQLPALGGTISHAGKAKRILLRVLWNPPLLAITNALDTLHDGCGVQCLAWLQGANLTT